MTYTEGEHGKTTYGMGTGEHRYLLSILESTAGPPRLPLGQ